MKNRDIIKKLSYVKADCDNAMRYIFDIMSDLKEIINELNERE